MSFHGWVGPIYHGGVAAFLLGLVVTEPAPWASARKAELLGEKPIAATAQRYNFVYRADGGWVYAIRSLELASREMRDVILEREGSGPDYPTIIVAAQRAVFPEPRRPGGGTRTPAAPGYLLSPHRPAAFR